MGQIYLDTRDRLVRPSSVYRSTEGLAINHRQRLSGSCQQVASLWLVYLIAGGCYYRSRYDAHSWLSAIRVCESGPNTQLRQSLTHDLSRRLMISPEIIRGLAFVGRYSRGGVDGSLAKCRYPKHQHHPNGVNRCEMTEISDLEAAWE
jgi:hypothetical protein